jgi:thioredoxin reductase (NADPH)
MYDLVIIGGGPAGLTAGIYAQRAMLETVLFEKLTEGGQLLLTPGIENYPGFKSISGYDLMNKMKDHATSLGLETKRCNVSSIEFGKEKKIISTEGTCKAKTIIVASGASHKELGVPGEKQFAGNGVSYCATCDGFFFKNKTITVVGGGNAAVEEALQLSQIGSKVYLIHRRDSFKADAILVEALKKAGNVDFVGETIVEEIKGGNRVEEIVVKNVKSGLKSTLSTDAVFIYIGKKPDTDFIDIKKDAGGFIITEENMETSEEGIFAAGDCRSKTLRQVSTAVSDGAIAVHAAVQYLQIH